MKLITPLRDIGFHARLLGIMTNTVQVILKCLYGLFSHALEMVPPSAMKIFCSALLWVLETLTLIL